MTGGFVRSAYKAAVGQGWIGPADFWTMPPGEFWWLVEAHSPAETEDYDELLDLLKEAPDNG